MAETVPLVVLNDDSTLDEIREALGHAAHDAHRMPVMDPRWPKRHAFIDALLDLYDAAVLRDGMAGL